MQHDLDGWEKERRKLEEENQRLRFELNLARQDLAREIAERTPIRLVDGHTDRPLSVIRQDQPHRPALPPPGDRGRRLAVLISDKHQARRERDLALAEVGRLNGELDTLRAKVRDLEEHVADLLRMGDDHA